MVVQEHTIELMKYLLKSKENELFNELHEMLNNNFDYEVIKSNNFLYAKGDIPVGLIAHVDTVYEKPPTIILHDPELNAMWSPMGLGADDRAGIFAILKILENGYRPTVIITKGEEEYGVGAREMLAVMPNCPDNLNFLIQLDRQGFDEAAFYGCDNSLFTKYIAGFQFEPVKGTFTDISFIAPQWGIAAVNLSVGYINEHSDIEHWFYDACYDTIDKVELILDDVENNELGKFQYIPRKERGYWDYGPTSEIQENTV